MMLFEEFFDHKTEQFAKPAIEHPVVHPYTLSMVKECIDALAQQPGAALDRNCRLYINRQQIDPFKAKKLMQQASKAPHFGVIDWQALCSGSDFLVFINHAALFSAALAQASQGFLGHFPTRFEPQGIAIEHHIIIGRYNETPFGVHVDDANDRVFHFNLGPAAKEMILWPRAAYLKAYPAASAQPLEKVSLTDALRYPMPVNSCFFLPADYYHVGRSSDNISAVVSLALSRMTLELQLKAATRELRNTATSADNTELYWRHFAEVPEKSAATALASAFDQCTFAGLLEKARARRLSNRSVVETQALQPPKLPMGPCQLRLSTNIPLQILQEPLQLHLYARGHHIKVSDAPTIEALTRILHAKSTEIDGSHICQSARRRDPLALAIVWLLATGSATYSKIQRRVVA